MAKVLIVDDEEVYRRQLQIAFGPDGHDTRTAAHGREALDLGARYRPDVLVTDWLLKNHMHGLQVARVLRSVLPDMRVVMMTGFPSDDLEADAAREGVIDFLQKPFGLERIRDAVRRADSAPAPTSSQPALAMFEVDSSGAILFANAAARALFGETTTGRGAARLSELFEPENMPALETAIDRWIMVYPRGCEPTPWLLRTQVPRDPSGSRLVLLRRNETLDAGHVFVEMLLGADRPARAQWAVIGRVLVLDADERCRRTATGLLESAGVAGYAVETVDEALRLIENDEGLRVVVLDLESRDGVLRAFIDKVRDLRPSIIFVGAAVDYCPDSLVESGVRLFLRKPWQVDDLANAVTGRFGRCPECGLQLPLRRPGPGEEGESWMCAFCGSRYRALLDESFPPDIRGNARRGDGN